MFGNLFAESWDRGTVFSTGSSGFGTCSMYLLKTYYSRASIFPSKVSSRKQFLLPEFLKHLRATVI
jgi:hypothetical protein